MDTACTRFIILSDARTGSNLLQQSLNSHPEVVCFRELFNLDAAYIDYDVEGFDGTSADDLALRAADPRAFLRLRVFGAHEPAVRAVGFKFHYGHFWFHEDLVPALTEDADLRVVHLRRVNMLRSLVSLRIAEQTGEWMRPDAAQVRRDTLRRKLTLENFRQAVRHPADAAGRLRRFLRLEREPAREARRAVTITKSECDAYFYRVKHDEQHFGGLFAAHDCMDVTFEDLTAERDRVVGDVLEFLRVTRSPSSTTLRRQNPEPLRELIANYDDLRSAFEGSPYADFFDS